MKIAEYNQMMSYLTRPAKPETEYEQVAMAGPFIKGGKKVIDKLIKKGDVKKGEAPKTDVEKVKTQKESFDQTEKELAKSGQIPVKDQTVKSQYKFTGRETEDDLYDLEEKGIITRDDHNVYSPRYLEYLDARVKYYYGYTKGQMNKILNQPARLNYLRAQVSPRWGEATFGDDYIRILEKARSEEINAMNPGQADKSGPFDHIFEKMYKPVRDDIEKAKDKLPGEDPLPTEKKRTLNAEGGMIGGGMIEGEDLGSRTGFAKVTPVQIENVKQASIEASKLFDTYKKLGFYPANPWKELAEKYNTSEAVITRKLNEQEKFLNDLTGINKKYFIAAQEYLGLSKKEKTKYGMKDSLLKKHGITPSRTEKRYFSEFLKKTENLVKEIKPKGKSGDMGKIAYNKLKLISVPAYESALSGAARTGQGRKGTKYGQLGILKPFSGQEKAHTGGKSFDVKASDITYLDEELNKALGQPTTGRTGLFPESYRNKLEKRMSDISKQYKKQKTYNIQQDPNSIDQLRFKKQLQKVFGKTKGKVPLKDYIDLVLNEEARLFGLATDGLITAKQLDPDTLKFVEGANVGSKGIGVGTDLGGKTLKEIRKAELSGDVEDFKNFIQGAENELTNAIINNKKNLKTKDISNIVSKIKNMASKGFTSQNYEDIIELSKKCSRVKGYNSGGRVMLGGGSGACDALENAIKNLPDKEFIAVSQPKGKFNFGSLKDVSKNVMENVVKGAVKYGPNMLRGAGKVIGAEMLLGLPGAPFDVAEGRSRNEVLLNIGTFGAGVPIKDELERNEYLESFSSGLSKDYQMAKTKQAIASGQARGYGQMNPEFQVLTDREQLALDKANEWTTTVLQPRLQEGIKSFQEYQKRFEEGESGLGLGLYALGGRVGMKIGGDPKDKKKTTPALDKPTIPIDPNAPTDPSRRDFMEKSAGIGALGAAAATGLIKFAPEIKKAVTGVTTQIDKVPNIIKELYLTIKQFGKQSEYPKPGSGNVTYEFNNYRLEEGPDGYNITRTNDRGDFLPYSEENFEVRIDAEKGVTEYDEMTATIDVDGKLKDTDFGIELESYKEIGEDLAKIRGDDSLIKVADEDIIKEIEKQEAYKKSLQKKGKGEND